MAHRTVHPRRVIPAILVAFACAALVAGPAQAEGLKVGVQTAKGLKAGGQEAEGLNTGRLRAGDPVKFSAASAHPYESGGWNVKIEHPGATYIAIHFDRFELGPGDRVVVRSPSNEQHWEYTGKGRAGVGEFWAVHIKGDAAVVELFDGAAEGGGWGVSIDEYVAGFIALGAESTESICTPDDKENAICYDDGSSPPPDDAAIYDNSRAVARLLIQGSFLCTGWLAGCEGHLFTNAHCIDNQTAAANTDYEFMAEAPNCGSANCQLCWAGTIWGGAATLVEHSLPMDYAFVHLAGSPQDTYGSFQIDPRNVVAEERIYIPQHPAGNAKEIGVSSSNAFDESGFCEIRGLAYPCADPVFGGLGDAAYHCDTEGGSSGSPVVAYSDHRVIALHHCAGCDAAGGFNLGNLALLPVVDLGEQRLPFCALDDGANLLWNAHAVDDSAGNNDGSPDPSETVVLPVDLRSDGNVGATGVSAVLSTTTPLVTILDNTASFPDIPVAETRASLAPHFTVQLDPSLPCGTTIDFDLTVTSNEGVFATSFEQFVGVGSSSSPFSYGSTDTPISIPDNNELGATSTLNVPDSKLIEDLNLTVNITHTWKGDLIVDLTSPGGTNTIVHLHTGMDADNIQTTYPIPTAPDRPGTMDDFDQENLQGDWTLGAADWAEFDTGTIQSWSIQGTELAPACIVGAASGAVPNGDTVPGTPLTVTRSLTEAAGDLTLAWGASCNGGDTDYEVYEGTLGSFSSHSEVTCSTATATSWTLTPSAGSTYYLVVPTNGTREGSYGTNSSASERGQGASACIGQQVAACP